MVVGLIVSALVYGWLCRSQDIQAELTQVPLLDRGLENGV